MDRMTTAQKIGVGGGVLLLVASFLPWYSVSLGGFGSFSVKAWDAGFLAWGGVVAGIAGAVLLAMKAMGTGNVQAGGFASEQIAMILGGASVVLIVLRLVTESSAVSFGLFLGLVGAALVAYGAWTQMKASGMTVTPGRPTGGPMPPTPPAP